MARHFVFFASRLVCVILVRGYLLFVPVVSSAFVRPPGLSPEGGFSPFSFNLASYLPVRLSVPLYASV